MLIRLTERLFTNIAKPLDLQPTAGSHGIRSPLRAGLYGLNPFDFCAYLLHI